MSGRITSFKFLFIGPAWIVERCAVLSSVFCLLRIGGALEIRLRNPLFRCLGAGGSSVDDSESSLIVALFLKSEGLIPLSCEVSILLLVTGLVSSLELS